MALLYVEFDEWLKKNKIEKLFFDFDKWSIVVDEK